MDTREAKCQSIAELIKYLRSQDSELSTLCEGLPVTLAEIEDPDTWIDWETAAELFDRFEHHLAGEKPYADFLRTAMPNFLGRSFGRLSSIAVPPSFFYRLVAQVLAPAMFPIHKASVSELPDERLQITLTLPVDRREGRAFFRGAAAIYEHLPELMGFGGPAHIVAEISDHEAQFFITPPNSRTLLSRLRRKLYGNTNQALLAELVRHRKELEDSYQELQEAYSELEERSEQLREAQKMEAIGQLSGGIAHDFNNSLTIVLGYTELLEHANKDPAIVPYIEHIQQAAMRSSELTRQLLAFARRQLLRPKVVDLNDLVAKSDNIVRTALGAEIDIVYSLDEALRPTRVDPGQLEQVLINLVLNAADAMSGNGQLTIATANTALDENDLAASPEVNPGAFVMLSVSDTGKGMPQAIADRVFEPFFTTRQKGTGLGLAMVHGIVAQSGGTIRVTSTEGAGTTFRVYLPRVDEPTDFSDEPIISEPATGGNEKILVVEDEPMLRNLVENTLTSYGYMVLVSRDGLEALSLVSEFEPDVILTDIVMPGISGIELARRTRFKFPEMPIVLMTGYSGDNIADRGEIEAGSHLLEKPFSTHELLSSVRDALKHRE